MRSFLFSLQTSQTISLMNLNEMNLYSWKCQESWNNYVMALSHGDQLSKMSLKVSIPLCIVSSTLLSKWLDYAFGCFAQNVIYIRDDMSHLRCNIYSRWQTSNTYLALMKFYKQFTVHCTKYFMWKFCSDDVQSDHNFSTNIRLWKS